MSHTNQQYVFFLRQGLIYPQMARTHGEAEDDLILLPLPPTCQEFRNTAPLYRVLKCRVLNPGLQAFRWATVTAELHPSSSNTSKYIYIYITMNLFLSANLQASALPPCLFCGAFLVFIPDEFHGVCFKVGGNCLLLIRSFNSRSAPSLTTPHSMLSISQAAFVHRTSRMASKLCSRF